VLRSVAQFVANIRLPFCQRITYNLCTIMHLAIFIYVSHISLFSSNIHTWLCSPTFCSKGRVCYSANPYNFGCRSFAVTSPAPSPPSDSIKSFGDCLEVKREYYRNCFILPLCYLFSGHSQQNQVIQPSCALSFESFCVF